MTDSFRERVLDATNHPPFVQPVEISYGSATLVAKFSPGERKEIVIGTDEKASQIVIRTRPYTPAPTISLKHKDPGPPGFLFMQSTIDNDGYFPPPPTLR